MRLNISTFWVEPIHRLPARLVISLLLILTPIFRFKKFILNKYSICPYGTHTINLTHIPHISVLLQNHPMMIPTPPILTSAVALCPKARYSVLGFPLNSLRKSHPSRGQLYPCCQVYLTSRNHPICLYDLFFIERLSRKHIKYILLLLLQSIKPWIINT